MVDAQACKVTPTGTPVFVASGHVLLAAAQLGGVPVWPMGHVVPPNCIACPALALTSATFLTRLVAVPLSVSLDTTGVAAWLFVINKAPTITTIAITNTRARSNLWVCLDVGRFDILFVLLMLMYSILQQSHQHVKNA